MTPFLNARVVLGVTGGIAAYKAADLASTLVQAGCSVDVVLTDGGAQFIQPMTFSAVTKRPVHSTLFSPWTADWQGHVSLAEEADLLIVAPASANALAGLALGLASDLLGTIALSTTAPVLLAPAMEERMFHHPATQAHLNTLRDRGAIVIGPEHGRLASGAHGTGRLAAVETIVGTARLMLGRNGPLAGRTIVVTAGGTHEPIDPVRYVGNRSSGAMGYALAQAGLDAGATVTLITGPSNLLPPVGSRVIAVTTAQEMWAAVNDAVGTAQALVMAAAVADFRPEHVSTKKLKKVGSEGGLTLSLVRNPDILASVDRSTLVKVGFAAETDDLEVNATGKLRAKGLAMIVANDATATIGAETSTASIVRPDAPIERLATMSKQLLAGEIIDRLGTIFRQRDDASPHR